MSKELVTIAAPPRALTLTKEESAEVMEAFQENLSSGSISEFDLPRIKVATGPTAGLWVVPTLEGEATVPQFEAVIVLARDTRAYYKSKEGSNTPPDCSSRDGLHGVGDPGGDCSKCALAEWDSDASGGGGQACRQSKQLFVLRGDSRFLEIASIPPTSLKGVKACMAKLVGQGIVYHRAIMRLKLEKATNAQNKPYGKAVLEVVRTLSPEERDRAAEFRQLALSIASRMTVTAAE